MTPQRISLATFFAAYAMALVVMGALDALWLGWLALDKRGALLVADDVGNVIWRVSGKAAPVAQR